MYVILRIWSRNQEGNSLSKFEIHCSNQSVIVVFQNHVNEAIEMYQEMHMWDDAIQVADAKVNLVSYLYLSVYFLCVMV